MTKLLSPLLEYWASPLLIILRGLLYHRVWRQQHVSDTANIFILQAIAVFFGRIIGKEPWEAGGWKTGARVWVVFYLLQSRLYVCWYGNVGAKKRNPLARMVYGFDITTENDDRIWNQSFIHRQAGYSYVEWLLRSMDLWTMDLHGTWHKLLTCKCAAFLIARQSCWLLGDVGQLLTHIRQLCVFMVFFPLLIKDIFNLCFLWMCKKLCYPFIKVVCYRMLYRVAVSQDFGPTFLIFCPAF